MATPLVIVFLIVLVDVHVLIDVRFAFTLCLFEPIAYIDSETEEAAGIDKTLCLDILKVVRR